MGQEYIRISFLIMKDKKPYFGLKWYIICIKYILFGILFHLYSSCLKKEYFLQYPKPFEA